MEARVKLCAIAKNEGPYLADWVFHHLYFGFDAIEVWVNGSTDGSLRILRAIGAKHPQVAAKRADRLLDECLASGKVFQHRAYTRLARKAERQGFTHVAFLDLDEYWIPKDFTSGIQAFVPDDPSVNVVSFQWGLDVPDPSREPYSPPVGGTLRLQLDRHVKSLARLDGSVNHFRAHTARTRDGVRLLVRDPFPLVKRSGQAGGSLVTEEFHAHQRGTLPEAFVLHAIHRSRHEYVASLTKGLRQSGSDIEFKQRHGFLPTDAPVLALTPPARPQRRYQRQRKRFHRGLPIGPLVRRAEELATARADGLLEAVAKDEALMAQLRTSLRGVVTSRSAT